MRPIKVLFIQYSFIAAILFTVQIGEFEAAKLDYNVLYNQRNSNQISGRSYEGPQPTIGRNATDPVCGYESCPSTSPNKINVHIIAHTHDDVGWLKTVDQYYYGTRKQYSPVGVQYILDSVIPQLLMDKSKRFIYVEMSFFSKWWQEQDDAMKNIVKRLVDEGRLEFINGGWCMNDEATVTYHSTIEQMTLGLKFLDENFGDCGRPKVGWQIDPFGHTNEQASLFAQFGFDGMFFTRESYSDKFARTENKSLDIIWHGDRALRDQSGSIFTNIFRDGYDAPNGYCFDAHCLDSVLVDNKKSYEYNIDSKGQRMISFIRDYAKAKLTNHVLIPFGGDFQFSAAGQNFKNLDKMIAYIQANAPDMNIFYSTPSCYQYGVYNYLEENKIKLPEKYDDFMPYDSSPTVWWSGFFASRPSVKLVERETANLLQVVRAVSLAQLIRQQSSGQTSDWMQQVKAHEDQCLTQLWEVLGDLQHHDAVTGTEKQHVADDYVRRAYDAWMVCVKFMGDIKRNQVNELVKDTPKYRDHVKNSGKVYNLEPVFLEDTMLCPLLNISQCDALESEVDVRRFLVNHTQHKNNPSELKIPSKLSSSVPSELQTRSVLMTAYNPLAKPINHHDIRLPCNGHCDLNKVKIINLATNETVKLIRLTVPSGIANLPFRDAKTSYEVLFYVDIPALGTSSFVIEDENADEIVDEEVDLSSAPLNSVESRSHATSKHHKSVNRNRRIKSFSTKYDYFDANIGDQTHHVEFGSHTRQKRDSSTHSFAHQDADRVVVKFDMSTGLITGLKRISDGSVLNITQKFGYYYPADYGSPPGAYIFRPNSSAPHLFEKPISYRMIKRQNGALIEIHQKWADWIWQTIRVDARKNYIEFDYTIGPIPLTRSEGREVVTRYITNMENEGVFMTDSGARQLMPRHKLRSQVAEQLGGSFYPVVSTILLRNNAAASAKSNKTAEVIAILVDRAQAGTSLNEGEIELLVHRRQLMDDHFGVSEALNEPGEDGRGLVTRGKHRLFLKFHDRNNNNNNDNRQSNNSTSAKTKSSIANFKPVLIKLPETPRTNLTYERQRSHVGSTKSHNLPNTYLIFDQVLNDLRQESIKAALKPVLTFDRLRVSARDFIDMVASSSSSANEGDEVPAKEEESLMNSSLPNNVHLLTLQPWNRGANELLIRLENLDNPLTLHPYPDQEVHHSLVSSYQQSQSRSIDAKRTDQTNDQCDDVTRPLIEVDVEFMLKNIRIVSMNELSLGANSNLKDVKRLDWTGEGTSTNEGSSCDSSRRSTSVKLAPRQIRTFIAKFERLGA